MGIAQINLNVEKYPLILENIMPWLIIVARTPSQAFLESKVMKQSEIFYANFNLPDGKSGEEKKERFEIPENLSKDLLDSLLIVRSRHINQSEPFLPLCEMILCFRNILYTLLANYIFCYNIIDINVHRNYTVSDIFDVPKYREICLDQNVCDSDAFLQAFSETSLFYKFIELSYEALYAKYVENREIPSNLLHVYNFVKTIVNAFEIMPSNKNKRKHFFDYETDGLFSLLSAHAREMEVFQEQLKTPKVVKLDLVEYLEYFLLLLAEKKVRDTPFPSTSLQDIHDLDTTFRSYISSNSNKPPNLNIGKNYFRDIRTEQLIDLKDKEHFDLETEFDQSTDIFSDI